MKPKKLLSIGYVGHRTGGRLSRDPQQIGKDLGCILEQLETAARLVFDSPDANKLFADEALSFSAIGGIAEGADWIIIKTLKEKAINVSLINSSYSENDDGIIMPDEAAQLGMPDIELDFEGKFRAHEQLIQSRSDMLIAIWDGEQRQGSSGGTVRAVRNALRFGIPVLWVHATEDQEPVLLSKREGEPLGALEKLLECAFDRQSCSQVDMKGVIARAMLPKAQVCQDKAFERYRNGVNECFVTNWIWDKLYRFSRLEWQKMFGANATDAGVEQRGIERYLSGTDRISGHMANRYRVSVLGLYLLSAFAVFWAAAGYVFEESFHHFSEDHLNGIHLAGWAEIAVIILIIFWFKWGDHRRWHGLWIHGRHLAEMLRMHQLLESVAGVSPFMLKQDSVHTNWAHWLYRRYAIAEPLCGAASKPLKVDNSLTPVYKEKISAYLQGQCDYHEKKVETEEVRHKCLHYGGYSFFAITLVAALAHLSGVGGHEAAPWLTLATIVLPAFGAAFHAIMVQEEIERLIHTSKAMKAQLAQLNDNLPTSDIASLRERSIKAADLMASEASNWHQMVGFKKLELPA